MYPVKEYVNTLEKLYKLKKKICRKHIWTQNLDSELIFRNFQHFCLSWKYSRDYLPFTCIEQM